MKVLYLSTFFFFFNDTATTEIYTLSLHDALPISAGSDHRQPVRHGSMRGRAPDGPVDAGDGAARPQPSDARPDSGIQRVPLGGAHADRRGGHAAPRSAAGPGGEP